jgi:hypothetical protein
MIAAQSQKARSGSSTSRASKASALASISSQAYSTWASLLLYPSFYLRVGSAKATAPSKAAITRMDVLILN